MSMLAMSILIFLTAAVLAPTRAVAQIPGCDVPYCNNRGTPTFDASTGCLCRCKDPYYGFRCVRSSDVDQLSRKGSTTPCSTDPIYADESSCQAEPSCFWNSSSLSCSNTATFRGNVTIGGTVDSTWCSKMFPLPLIMAVYGCATVAFGFSFVGVVYLFKYHDVFSVIEENGQRMFNVYFHNTPPLMTYCLCLFTSSGFLAITAFINFQQPSECNGSYAAAMILYPMVQLVPVVGFPVYWLIKLILAHLGKNLEERFDLDTVVRPTTATANDYKERCQLRMF